MGPTEAADPLKARTPRASPAETQPSATEVADSLRQVFNDTDAEQLWLVVGAPPEPANTLEMSEEQLKSLYPDGPKALPPELSD